MQKHAWVCDFVIYNRSSGRFWKTNQSHFWDVSSLTIFDFSPFTKGEMGERNELNESFTFTCFRYFLMCTTNVWINV